LLPLSQPLPGPGGPVCQSVQPRKEDCRLDGDRLSESELLATLFLLISAGYDTTVNVIANGILALLRNPAQLAALRADPSQMTTAVEEILRPIEYRDSTLMHGLSALVVRCHRCNGVRVNG
jgi:hypothetical protein